MRRSVRGKERRNIMDKENIAELLSAIINEDFETICKYANAKQEDVAELDDIDDLLDDVGQILMRKIEEGDYGYFIDVVKKNPRYFITLLKYSTKVNDIRAIIEDRESLGLSKRDVIDLIGATKDFEYIIGHSEELGLNEIRLSKLIIQTKDFGCIKRYMKYIQGECNLVHVFIDRMGKVGDKNLLKQCIEARDELGLNSKDVADLIKGTEDIDYIKQCIEARDELGLNSNDVVDLIKGTEDRVYIEECIKRREELGLSSSAVVDLIKGTEDRVYIEECIKRREELGLSSSAVVDLIKGTKDIDYIKECVEDREKLGLISTDVVKLIKGTEDIDYIKECIEDREKLGLSSSNVVDLIKYTKDIDYIKECIEDREKLGLNSTDVVDLIKGTEDIDYIKECIEDREKLRLSSSDVVDLIKYTKDIDYIKECIEDRKKLGLNSTDVVDLIKGTEDIDYIKECIEDREKLGLSLSDVVDLIKDTKDIDYIKECIKRREELGLNLTDIVELIKGTEDIDYIKQCINDREKWGLNSSDVVTLIKGIEDIDYIKECIERREKLGLDSKNVTELILVIGDIKYIYQCKLNGMELENERISMFDEKIQINLPEDMTVGIEIETEGETETEKIGRILNRRGLEWNAKYDGSLRNGTEVVSPVLKGDNKKNSDAIKSVCAILNGISQTTSERCGGHIHIGANYLTNKQDWLNLIEIWGNAEKLLYIISNEAGDIPRDGVPQYASPISKKFENGIENGTINLQGEEDLHEFVSQVIATQKLNSETNRERYSGINFLNVGLEGKNTIEFRLANGTVNPKTWIENINLFGGIVRSAHELTIIQEKPEGDRTEKESEMLESFRIIQVEQDEQLILKALLELTVSTEQRQIYIERYNINSVLLRNNKEMEEAITKQISTNKLGKKVFTGNEAINGEDYQQGVSIIEQDLIRHNGLEQENSLRRRTLKVFCFNILKLNLKIIFQKFQQKNHRNTFTKKDN